MGSPIEAFKQQRILEFSLPSGLVLTIRKPQQWDFLAGGELPLPQAPSDGALPPAPETNAARAVLSYTEQAMLHCVLDPPLCVGRDPEGHLREQPGHLHLDYLDPQDYAALARELLRLGGFLPEDASAIQAFRADPLGPTGESPGGAVPPLAVAGDAQQPGGDVLRFGADVPVGTRADTPALATAG